MTWNDIGLAPATMTIEEPHDSRWARLLILHTHRLATGEPLEVRCRVRMTLAIVDRWDVTSRSIFEQMREELIRRAGVRLPPGGRVPVSVTDVAAERGR